MFQLRKITEEAKCRQKWKCCQGLAKAKKGRQHQKRSLQAELYLGKERDLESTLSLWNTLQKEVVLPQLNQKHLTDWVLW